MEILAWLLQAKDYNNMLVFWVCPLLRAFLTCNQKAMRFTNLMLEINSPPYSYGQCTIELRSDSKKKNHLVILGLFEFNGRWFWDAMGDGLCSFFSLLFRLHGLSEPCRIPSLKSSLRLWCNQLEMKFSGEAP